ncbi:MAG: hypothetical protein MUP98_01950 [Candidatus Aminicenantes bacterium]|nr:hypothetical protein [Candidatus Aminicenantes bacterium]
MMEKFNFLLGNWDMEYHVPKSVFSEAVSGTGTGTFKRALDDKYVYFDYSSLINKKKGQAHAIFFWDEKAKIIRFFWFESSGNFSTATCEFINENILFLNWHDTLLRQTFRKINSNKVILRMENPDSNGNYKLVLEVIFTRSLFPLSG